MLRKIMFVDNQAGTEMCLPVTPKDFTVEHGMTVETIGIHALGDVVVPTYHAVSAIKLDCIFPAQDYPFVVDKTYPSQPYKYVERFISWANGKNELRLIVSNTEVNLPVFVEYIQYGERDGTNDIYATISLREYRKTGAVKYESSNSLATRAVEGTGTVKKETNYVIKSGDTLSAICRKYYGDSSKAMYTKLANYNGIKNPNLIYTGNVLKIPPKGNL